uniref:Glucose-methanol-choline oxidoreductase C-terminal domain-containing protein n=1 Tax=Scylla olivacea TaxID=85551 RepID=A0A0P4WUU6_SCYOL
MYQEYYGSVLGKVGFTMLVSLLHPKSTGTISLLSTDPRDPPVIDPKFLSHPDDLHTLVKGECGALHSHYSHSHCQDAGGTVARRMRVKKKTRNIGDASFNTWPPLCGTQLARVGWAPPVTLWQ